VRKIFVIFPLLMIFCITGTVHAVYLDDFNGKTLDKMWTYRDPAKKGTYKLEGGKLLLALKAGADMYIQGVDGGVCFLMDPPNLDNFSIETMVNSAVPGTQPPACQPGLIFFNEAKWAYSIWGPYANTDIRLEDCVGGTYRWRADAQIGIDLGDIQIDQDVYIRITKTGSKLEFFAKNSEDAKWVSGGVDAKLGPNYTAGSYKVGLVAKSWGGSIDSEFEFDYFDIPEIAKAVSSQGKTTSTWAAIKNK